MVRTLYIDGSMAAELQVLLPGGLVRVVLKRFDSKTWAKMAV